MLSEQAHILTNLFLIPNLFIRIVFSYQNQIRRHPLATLLIARLYLIFFKCSLHLILKYSLNRQKGNDEEFVRRFTFQNFGLISSIKLSIDFGKKSHIQELTNVEQSQFIFIIKSSRKP